MSIDASQAEFALAVLDILPNPVLVKDDTTRYVWVNRAFEELFSVERADLVGQFDKDVFVDRQAAQCNGGDLRVLESGEVDEAYETVFDPDGRARETITRKIRLDVSSNNGIDRLLVGVMHDVTDVTEANRKLERTSMMLEEHADRLRILSETDPLTGCLNRRAIFSRSKPLLVGGGAVLLIDIDHFKAVNDSLGHAAGDQALVALGERVRSVLRPRDEFARLGGEEFVVVCPATSEGDAEALAESIRATVDRDMLRVDKDEVRMTVSVGVAVQSGGESTDLGAWLRVADERLYAAKQAGRNRVVAA